MKCDILSLKTVVGQLCKPNNMKDESLVSEVESKAIHLLEFRRGAHLPS